MRPYCPNPAALQRYSDEVGSHGSGTLPGRSTMSLTKIYGRALALLAHNRRTLAMLAAGNLGVAALQFLDPLLFGRVIGLLARTDTTPHAQLFAEGGRLVACGC